jgi:phosphoribosylamine--glycine ligase
VAERFRNKLIAAFDNGKIRVIPRENPQGNRLDLRRDIGVHYLVAESIFPEK